MPDSQKPHEEPEEHKHHVLEKFMNATDRMAKVIVAPQRGDPSAPVVHKHDDFEQASEDELRTFEVETDSEGHHYAVRKDTKP
ncbi:hypothetical protein SPF06_09650 [Sinomonas sp. JGH33]|uniref:Uncharacterized protein n=1 Tax=Sinomonas terricola TaxID=3110330 RepID=A0ABU5T5N6_9MICC|nr:hypothetical protein [Sinomonas sp. JGH33]MEA5454982.1 hypothetical protein [Sinomonas sp. JGH33]